LPIGRWAEPQKRAWVNRHFPGIQVITTLARNKVLYCTPGDVLVDDQDRYRSKWEKAGGVFIHHTSAKDSLAALKKLGMLGTRRGVTGSFVRHEVKPGTMRTKGEFKWP
jgi:hypothetical protein